MSSNTQTRAYTKAIALLANDIKHSKLTDYEVVKRFKMANNLYRQAVEDGNGLTEPIRTHYITKEAYRIAAADRGYTIDVLLMG